MKAMTFTTIILYVAGFVFVLFFFAALVYPAILGIIQGECWGVNTYNTIKEIKAEFEGLTPGGQSKKMEVVLGDCVEHIAFVDKDTLADYYLNYFLKAEAETVFKCPDTEKFSVYIIAIPYFEETKSGLRFWRYPKDFIKEEIDKLYKEKFRQIKPMCDILDSCEDCYYKSGSIETRVLEGSRKRGEPRTYCLTMSKTGQLGKQYEISVKLGGC